MPERRSVETTVAVDPIILPVTKRKPKFSYNLFGGTGKAKSFWRWEAYDVHTKIICEAGILYGTREEAAAMAASAITRLSAPADGKSKIANGAGTGRRGSKRPKP